MITHTRPNTGWREAVVAARVVASKWLGEGRYTDAFRAEFARFAQVDAANLALMFCASDALCLSMELLNVGPGDEVIVPAIHFVGAANAVLRRGATPVFCDVNRYTLNTDAPKIRAKVTDRTKAILLLHYALRCADMDAILGLGLPVVEDCCVALGVVPRGEMACWSFDPMKLIATPDGGALWCKEAAMTERARRLSGHGMNQLHGYASKAGTRWWEFEVLEPGRLSEFNDVAAAIGLSQLKRIPSSLLRRREIAWQYQDELSHLLAFGAANYNLCPVQTPYRDKLARHLRDQGIYVTMRYFPLHLAYHTGEILPGAEYAANRTLLLPLHAGLSHKDVRYIVRTVKEFFNGTTG